MFKDNLEALGEQNICDHDCAISIKSYTWKNLLDSNNLEKEFHRKTGKHIQLPNAIKML